MLGAEEADLLANRERDLEVAVGNVALADDAQHLADDREAGLVVAAEHGGPVAADGVTLEDGFHPFAGDDGIHVRRQQERLDVDRSGHAREEISGGAADLRGGVVEPHLRAEVVELALEPACDRELLSRVAVDAHELEEETRQAFGRDERIGAHGRTLYSARRRMHVGRTRDAGGGEGAAHRRGGTVSGGGGAGRGTISPTT